MSFEPDNLNILIVDDTSANLKTLTAILSERGYQVRPAINGEVALNAASKKQPDLILLDIRMPGMDGYEVCRRLKEDQLTRDTPVIFISALDEAMDKVKAFELGGVDYITKPFQSEEVLARVKTHLSLRRMQARVEHQNTQLQQANAKLKELDRLKAQFLGNMSHELRTPLNSIIGFTSIILQGLTGEITDEQRKQLEMVYDSGRYLLSLINDVLDLSNITAGRMEVMPETFSLAEAIDSVIAMVTPLANSKNLKLVTANMPPSDFEIYTDKGKTKQILNILINNAVKFTERGQIEINTNFTPEGDEIEISVSDTGDGIKEEALEYIFDEFRQVEGTVVRDEAGVGLGLSISQKLVELLKGKIRAESEYGVGSKFTFNLPL
jgi:signal transduction histidine kinase